MQSKSHPQNGYKPVHTPGNGSSIRHRLDSVQHPSLQAYVDLAFDRDSRVSRALPVARHQTG